MDNTIVLLILLLLGIVMMFAQVRLFSIDRTLKEIKGQLAASPNRKSEPATASPFNPLSIK